MIEKQTIIDQIEIKRTGAVHIRLGLLLVEDGREISCNWHRTVVEPGTDSAEQMGVVNNHLAQMGWPAVPQDDQSKLAQHASLVQVPSESGKTV